MFDSTLPTYNVNLHIVPSEKSPDEEKAEVSLKDKIIQISSLALMFSGALFLMASAGLFVSSLFVASASLIMLGEVMYPLGILSLLAGINLFQDGRASSLKISSRLGPVSLSM